MLALLPKGLNNFALFGAGQEGHHYHGSEIPFVLDQIGDQHRNNTFAIIIDEAHSSQGGRTASKMNMVLAESSAQYGEPEPEEDIEDAINKIITSRKMLQRKLLCLHRYAKNKTLEIFGVPFKDGDTVKHRPFHAYTMKQAIQEGFILDVLQNYTPVDSYYRLIKSVENDPEFDTKRQEETPPLCRISQLRYSPEGGDPC